MENSDMQERYCVEYNVKETSTRLCDQRYTKFFDNEDDLSAFLISLKPTSNYKYMDIKVFITVFIEQSNTIVRDMINKYDARQLILKEEREEKRLQVLDKLTAEERELLGVHI